MNAPDLQAPAGNIVVPNDYPRLLVEVKKRIRAAQYEALKRVNTELVGLYWDIGRMIVERQAGADQGESIVEQLARDLRAEFPGINGFSRRNVFYVREFYLLYRDDKRVQPLVAQIGWSHNLAVLQRCKDPLEREFYIRATQKFGWSKTITPSIFWSWVKSIASGRWSGCLSPASKISYGPWAACSPLWAANIG